MNARRSFLRSTIASAAALSFGVFFGCGNKKYVETSSASSLFDDIGSLLAPNGNGLMLPGGFASRIIARSGLPPHIGSSYLWHDAPDGGATFPTSDGGWIYVSNSEGYPNLLTGNTRGCSR